MRIVGPLTALVSIAALLPLSATACKKPAATDGTSPEASASAEVATDDDVDGDVDDDATPGPSPSANRKHKRSHPNAVASADAAPSATVAPTPTFVIHKPTPEPMPAPPVASAPVMPALPSLPPPSKYPPPPTLPKAKDTEECGQVWSGTEYVAVECLDPEAHSKSAKAARVVIPYDRMKPVAEALPKIVDHRAEGTEGPMRAQGKVPACTAFAFTAALDHAYARWTGKPGAFSVMQVWARYHTHSERDSAENNIGDLIANESDWPYDVDLAGSWNPCPKDPKKQKTGQVCGKSPDADKLKSLDKGAVAELTQIEVIPPSELDVLREKLAGGQDVAIALRMPSFATAGDPGAKYIIGYPKGHPEATKTTGGHEIALAGYAMTPNGNYYLVHNSMGTKWGDDGFAWLHEDFLKAYWNDRLMVIPDVEPIQVERRRTRRRGQLAPKCDGDKAPDSISAMCASKCPDGSPRHNNVCADDKKKECPVGFVNLTGECVLGAPKSQGTDPTSKVKWECGHGGCVYDIPKGKLDCKEASCQFSCPAPDFRLATTAKGLVCVE